jgi:hypothetical protein
LKQCDEGIVYYRKTGQRARVALDEPLVAETFGTTFTNYFAVSRIFDRWSSGGAAEERLGIPRSHSTRCHGKPCMWPVAA